MKTFRFTRIVCPTAPGVDPALLLEPVQRRVERPLAYRQHIARERLNPLRYRPTVQGFSRDGLENQEVERALQQIRRLRHVNTSMVDNIPRTSTICHRGSIPRWAKAVADAPGFPYRYAYHEKRDTLFLVIASFRCKDTERIFRGQASRKFANIHRVAFRGLIMLNAAEKLSDLAGRGASLEALKGDRAGQYSIRINDQFRVCFRWVERDAFDVEILDYH